MSKASEVCKCIDYEDKKLMLRIMDEAITRESMELRKIETRRMQNLLKPQFVESFLGISSSLVRTRKDFKQNMENLKKRLEGYPECIMVVKPQEIGYNVKISQAEIPIPYAERKLK